MSVNKIPQLSVVTPTYNRSAILRRCLAALERQTAPPDAFEVIVVVDGSVDNTVEMLQSLQTPFALSIVTQKNSGVSAARNHGARLANGRYLLFIDDDIMAAPGLVAAHIAALEQEPGRVVLGYMSLEIPADADPFTRQNKARWDAHYTALSAPEAQPSWMDCYSGNFSLSREDFLAAGGFAVDLRRSVDVELGYRLAQAGHSFRYEPKAAGAQDDDKDMAALLRDAERSGSAWMAVVERHPASAPQLLGGFANASTREAWAHRLLLRVGFPAVLLMHLGRFVASESWRGRWYRFLHNHAYWRGMRRGVADERTWRRLMSGTRILFYHAFCAPGERASRFVLPVRELAWQLRWLRRRGYTMISLAELVEDLRAHRLPPERSMVLTFDDGYVDNQAALELLAEDGTPVTFFAVAERLGLTNDWSDGGALRGRKILSSSEIAAVASQGGVIIGAHSCTHAHLETLSGAALSRELADSRRRLEELVERPVTFFAYPFGEFGPREVQAAEKTGYLAACGVESGGNSVATPLHALRRDEVSGNHSRLRFMLRFW